jgi:hypothetical protein
MLLKLGVNQQTSRSTTELTAPFTWETGSDSKLRIFRLSTTFIHHTPNMSRRNRAGEARFRKSANVSLQRPNSNCTTGRVAMIQSCR